MASGGTDANNNRSRGSDGWESSENRGDQGHWHHRSRDWYADAGGHWESQRWEGSRPDDDRSRGPIWESQAWGDHRQVNKNHSRGWEEQPPRGKGAEEQPPPETAQPALLNVAAGEIQQEPPVGGLGGCGVEGCPCGSACVTADIQDPVLDLTFFQQSVAVPPWKEHSAALKWLRFKHKSVERFKLPPQIEKEKIQHFEGPSYAFYEGVKEPWSWVSMVASLDTESMQYVVTNEGRSRGLCCCYFSPRPKSYDHQSAAAARKKGIDVVLKPQSWDLLLTRDDGSAVRLHPEWSKTKFNAYPEEGPATEMPTPKKGFGKSAGRGSFKAYKNDGVEKILRFDAQKVQQLQQGSNAAVAASSLDELS